ncbi:class I SAM-dependent methyltransferase [Muricauda oceani]|uniref:Class I SAM-dependent methyltransferase n=1 Tax=Flagellimonas oceani TaxID=2698672 RepID=A0A6G7J0S1_9FLAO|nr:class I SAM-dependent methyltransferase [Allomuricauda oceani]QII44164.1 class I SAM-dependent methyltransferase [Allomuricauda oceani]
MNKLILNTGAQDFILKNLSGDIMSVLLVKPLFEGISQKELAEQIEAKNKSKDKLPIWFSTPNIYYPNKLNIEQTSSELTATYKARLVNGKSLVDLTGGFGVDTYFFSQKIAAVFHCEINQELSEIAHHNFEILGQKNIECLTGDGIDFLKNVRTDFDWIYVDPSRRNDAKGKVFLLEDCLPNLPEHLPLLFEKTQHILVKTSPLLDIKLGIEELRFVKEVHVVAVQNEVKELLFVLEKGFTGSIKIKTINIAPQQDDTFNFELEHEHTAQVEFGEPSAYLYEPNSAILKSGGFKSVAKYHDLAKLHPHSHLYTSDRVIDFPGRRFKVNQVLPYSKKSIKSLGVAKANITTRNFPITVAELRKKHNIKDGGNRYLFFTKSHSGSLLVLDCEKLVD